MPGAEDPHQMTRSPRTMARRAGQLVLAVVLATIVAGCASNAPQDSLKPAGTYARKIDNLFDPVFYIAVVVFILVEGIIVIAIIRFRRRDDDGDDEFPNQIHGNTRLEIGWTILPALLLAGVAFATIPLIFQLNEKPKNAMNVTVIGQKYWWAYEYPAQDKFGITKKITT